MNDALRLGISKLKETKGIIEVLDIATAVTCHRQSSCRYWYTDKRGNCGCHGDFG